MLTDVLGRAGRGELHPPRAVSLPLGEAGAVLKRYAERSVTGKYVLVP